MDAIIIIAQIFFTASTIIQYGVIAHYALDGEVDELITTKRLFWIWIIPSGTLILVFQMIKKFYKSLGEKKKKPFINEL